MSALILAAAGAAFSQPPTGPYFGQEPPGLIPQVLAPGFISAGTTELAGALSPDGTEFFFTRRPDAQGSDNRLFYTRMVDGMWSVPELAPFALDYMEFEPHFTPDGSRLYFESKRPRPAGETRKGAIWYSQKTDTGWSDARYFQAPVNDDFAMFVSSTRTGTFYFTGIVGRQVGVCRCKFENGKYGAVEMIPVIDPPLSAAHPFVAPDESYLVFDAQAGAPAGRPDLYVSFPNPDGSWGKGIKLPTTINTGYGELCPGVSPDERYLFFSRFDDNGGDIYWVDFDVVRSLK